MIGTQRRRATSIFQVRARAALRFVVPGAALALLGCARSDGAVPDSHRAGHDAALRAAMADSTQWPSYGRDYSNQRYSPLTQVNAGNVAQLQLAWHFKTGLAESFEASPLVVGRTMYVTTPMNHLFALDAVTGAKKWEYVHPLGTTTACCGPVNRGAAYYGGRVYMATLDGQVVALDTATGHPAWTVQAVDNKKGYSLTLAPVIVAGKVIVGASGAEYGIRGRVMAFDANDGALLWRWYTIPSPEEGGWWGHWSTTDPFGTPMNRDVAQEKRDSAKYADAWKRGGGSVWQTPAVDVARGLLVLTVNNPSPDIDGAVRPGDNLYTDCIVALDLATGKLRWYFQQLPHDTWDYDPISPPVLVDVKDSSGRTVAAVAEAGKTGWVYVLNRDTGKPIRRSDAFVEQKDMFTRATREGVRLLPGGNGGTEWSPTAYSPQTGYMYILGLNQHEIYKLRPEKYAAPASYLTGVWYSGEPTKDYGSFTAMDLNTGHIAWQDTVPHPMVGGAMATAGGVVFVGTKDRRALGIDARSGHILWTYAAPAGVNAPPVTYMIDGRQYVAVAAGGNLQINAPRGDEVLVFALPVAGARDTSFAVPASAGSAAAAVLSRR
jgi:alcohol dehydrogenase (cytochrome c)